MFAIIMSGYTHDPSELVAMYVHDIIISWQFMSRGISRLFVLHVL